MGDQARDKSYDVILIGGGINGVGVARDCAMRGLKVALFEKGDLCRGSTGACSGMIHGGPRYLETERKTTELSCKDSAIIQKIAPNLLFRIPILIPVLDDHSKIYTEMVETFAWSYDSFSQIKGGKPHVRLNREEVHQLDARFSKQIRAAVTMDEWGIDPFRLVILNARSAQDHGVDICLWTEVSEVLSEEGKVKGVKVLSHEYGSYKAYAPVVVNLAGPWATEIDRKKMKSLQLRPSKGVHVTLDRRVVNVSLICPAVDGRESVFLLPHEHTTIIGTTDDDYYGSPDHIPITHDEVSYLLQAVERYFPSIKQHRVMRAWAGIRPTLPGWGMMESQLSRDHLIQHYNEEGYEGLFSMIGGKLAAYRLMAEEMTDEIMDFLGKPQRCLTQTEALPGCTEELPWKECAKRYQLPSLAVKRLFYRQGSFAHDILETTQKNPELSAWVCEDEWVSQAEVLFVLENEWAQDVNGLRRRTRLGMGPSQGSESAMRAAFILGESLDWSIDQIKEEADQFLKRRYDGNQPSLFGAQAKQFYFDSQKREFDHT